MFNGMELQDKSLESHNYCFLFGRGSRLCPGKELGIVIISTFLHYFVTQYRLSTNFSFFYKKKKRKIGAWMIWKFCCRWEEVGGDEILEFPRVEAPNGLHIRVSEFWKITRTWSLQMEIHRISKEFIAGKIFKLKLWN